jgi:hypothetical protein
MEAAIETIEYDVVEENYGEFIEVLRTVLTEYEPACDRQSVVDYHHAPHPVLPRQRNPHRPARWILITLLLRDEGHATTLAIRDDNVYLIGFRNRRGQWYEFGFGRGRSARVLPAEWSLLEPRRDGRLSDRQRRRTATAVPGRDHRGKCWSSGTNARALTRRTHAHSQEVDGLDEIWPGQLPQLFRSFFIALHRLIQRA